MEHRVFTQSNMMFRDCCVSAGVDPTKRQASKFRNGRGSAFRKIGSVLAEIKRDLESKKHKEEIAAIKPQFGPEQSPNFPSA